MTGENQGCRFVVINSVNWWRQLLKWGIQSTNVGRSTLREGELRVPFWTTLSLRYSHEPSKVICQAGNWLAILEFGLQKERSGIEIEIW